MKIDFFLVSTMEVFHFAPVLLALNRLGHDAKFISPQLTKKTDAEGWSNAEEIDHMLEENHYPFEKHPRVWAEVAITTQSASFLWEYPKLKVRMMYGLGLVPPSTQNMDYAKFDHYLVHGPLAEKIQFWYHACGSPPLPPHRVHTIGYPKLDPYFQKRTDVVKFRESKGILWLPTARGSSSLDTFGEAISKLDGYARAVRPHHATSHDEPTRMAIIEKQYRLSNNTKNFFHAYDDTNLILADVYSGAFTEAMLTGKPVIGLGAGDLLADVPEYLRCRTPEELPEKVKQAQCAPKPLLDYFFTTTHGHDGEVAAKVIEGLNG